MVEGEVHHRRSELELERKKWEFNLKDAEREYSHMENQIYHLQKEIVISRQTNEEELAKLQQ